MLVSYFTYSLSKLRVTWEREIFAARHSGVRIRDWHIRMPSLLASLWLCVQGVEYDSFHSEEGAWGGCGTKGDIYKSQKLQVYNSNSITVTGDGSKDIFILPDFCKMLKPQSSLEKTAVGLGTT